MGEACQGFFKWLFDVTDLLSLWLQLGFNWAQRSHRDTTDQHVVAVQRNPQRKPKNHSDPWEGPSRLPGPPCNHCRYCLLKGRGIMQLPAALFVAGIMITKRSSNIIIWYDMGASLQGCIHEVCCKMDFRRDHLQSFRITWIALFFVMKRSVQRHICSTNDQMRIQTWQAIAGSLMSISMVADTLELPRITVSQYREAEACRR